jgi:hypothetical protein
VVLALLVCAYNAPRLLAGTVQYDGVDVHYSAQRYLSDEVLAGRLPVWTPYLFAGFPFLADLQVGAWYPLNWPFFLMGITPTAIHLELLLHSLIACAGAYVLAIRLIGQPTAGVAVAVLYGLSGWFATHSQHVGMFQAAAWLPWLLLALDSLATHLSLGRLAAAALLGAAVALPGHFQVALYAFSGAAVWALLRAGLAGSAIKAGRVVVGLLATGVWGGLISAVMVLPGLELVSQSTRPQLRALELPELGYLQLDALLTLVQPDHFGLLSGHYVGPGDVTQHYFYAGILLIPLALLGVANWRVLLTAVFIGLPFAWYAVGPEGGLFRLVARLPAFRSVELPMHGWFLPTLALALLGGAGLIRLPAVARPLVVAALFVDVLVFNQLQNPLSFARVSFDELYGTALRAFDSQLQAALPPVDRLYGAPLAAVGYRNHPLQSRVEAIYGYNPLELAAYTVYADAAERNPRLIDGLAATHRLADGSRLEPNLTALPRAFFARRVTSVSDPAAAAGRLIELDPAEETLVIGLLPGVQPDANASALILDRGGDHVTLHYTTANANLLRIAIPFYPGWHAAVGGQELSLVPVDYALLGVVVPAGEGDLRVWYSPRFLWIGASISALALIGAVAACARALRAQ